MVTLFIDFHDGCIYLAKSIEKPEKWVLINLNKSNSSLFKITKIK
jgi:hypothetical protein